MSILALQFQIMMIRLLLIEEYDHDKKMKCPRTVCITHGNCFAALRRLGFRKTAVGCHGRLRKLCLPK